LQKCVMARAGHAVSCGGRSNMGTRFAGYKVRRSLMKVNW